MQVSDAGDRGLSDAGERGGGGLAMGGLVTLSKFPGFFAHSRSTFRLRNHLSLALDSDAPPDMVHLLTARLHHLGGAPWVSANSVEFG